MFETNKTQIRSNKSKHAKNLATKIHLCFQGYLRNPQIHSSQSLTLRPTDPQTRKPSDLQNFGPSAPQTLIPLDLPTLKPDPHTSKPSDPTTVNRQSLRPWNAFVHYAFFPPPLCVLPPVSGNSLSCVSLLLVLLPPSLPPSLPASPFPALRTIQDRFGP